jgi:hypothetical protein
MTPGSRRTSFARNRSQESGVLRVAALALLDPQRRCSAVVVEAVNRPVRPGQSGDYEAHPGK